MMMEEVEMAREMVAVGLMIHNVIGFNKPSPFFKVKISKSQFSTQYVNAGFSFTRRLSLCVTYLMIFERAGILDRF